MAYQRLKESSEADDDCRLLPTPDFGALPPNDNYRRLTTGCLIFLLLLLSATNAATAIYFTKIKKDAPIHTYSMTCKHLLPLELQTTDTNKLPSNPLESTGQHSKL